MRRLPLERLTMTAALALGFSLTLGVWLFTGYYFTRRLNAVEAEAHAISTRYMRAQERLSNISAQVLLTSVYLRDALLAADPAAIGEQRLQLERTYDEIDRELDDYVPVVNSEAERRQVERLRQEVDAFRVTSHDVLGSDRVRSPSETRAVLNTRVVPRRQTVIRVSEDVRALNRVAFIEQQRAIGELHRLADRRTWQWLGATLAISLGIGLLATAYATRLEGSLKRQRELEALNSRHLQLLSAKLITTQEEERTNIARELHDEVGQALMAIKVELAVAQRKLAAGGSHADLLEEVQLIADRTLGNVRDLSHLLHPALLDDLGLPAAVDWYLRAFAKRHAIDVELQHEGMSQRLAPEIELAAYRVVQESLTNVARHAQATHCRVTLRRAGGRVDVIVQDNGQGLRTTAGHESSVRHGLGFIGMRERAAQLKGTVCVDSEPGAGTRITLRLPAILSPEVDLEPAETIHG